jgi:O-antigen/teichoic acid export membrane protein
LGTGKRLVKNFFSSFLTQISNPIASLIFIFIIARQIGISGLGEYSAALSMYYIFQAVSSFGFNLLITKNVSQDHLQVNKYFVNGIFLAFFFSVIAGVIMIITGNCLTPNDTIRNSVYLLSISLCFFSLSVVFQSICRAFEKLEYITIAYVIGNIFKIFVGTTLLLKNYGLVPLIAVIAGSQIIIFIISLCFALKFVTKKKKKIDLVFCKKIIKDIPVFTFIIIFSTIRVNISVILLTRMVGVEEAGYYSAAYKLVNVFKLGISCYIMAFQPLIFRIFTYSKERFKLACTESIRFLAIIVFPVVLGCIILSERIIVIIFGTKFLPSANALSTLILLLLFYSFNQVLANALIGSNYQIRNLKANIIGLIASFGINIILIYLYGFVGAAIATVVSVFIVAAFQYYYVSQNLFKIKIRQMFQKPLISVALMTVVLFLIKNNNLIFIVITCAITYVFCLLSLRTFSQKDLQVVKDLWKKEASIDHIYN